MDRRTLIAVFIASCLATLAFILDRHVSVGHTASEVFYIPMLICGFWFRRIWAILPLVGTATILLLTSHFHHIIPEDRFDTDFFLNIAELWGIAILLMTVKHTQNRLNEHSDTLQLVMDNIPALVSYIGTDLRYILVNKRYEELFCRPAHTIIGTHIRDIAGRDTYRKALPYLRQVRKGQEVSYEYWWQDGNASPMYLRTHLIPHRNPAGIIAGFFCMVYDLTAAKQAEQLARENERKFTTLMGNLPGMVYRCNNDRDWTMEFMSNGCTVLTGYAPEAFLGEERILHYNDLILPAFREKVWEQVQEAVNNHIPFEITYCIRNRDGSVKWVWEQGAGVYDDNDTLVALEGYIMDISELKTAEHALENTIHDLTLSNSALERFAFVVSHDLREPLRTMGSFAQLLQKKYSQQLDSNGRLYLRHMVKSTNDMRLLIHDLLASSRTSLHSVTYTSVNCEELVATILESLHEQVRENGAIISYRALPIVPGDKTHLRQLFQNLISNAIRYRTEDKPPTITISAITLENGWQFSIRDNGRGIPEEEHKTVMEFFSRGNNSHDTEGYGLGLGICRNAVVLHGGRIWMESSPGKGTTFHFTLHNRVINPKKTNTDKKIPVTTA